MLDPALYAILAPLHPGSALVLDLVSPWVVGRLFYADLRKREGVRIVSISGKDLVWWWHLVMEEVYDLYMALGPDILIEVDNYSEVSQFRETYFQPFLEDAPPVLIHLINQE
jgi:hypothetical protein